MDSFWLGLLVLMLRSSQGAGEGECPSPPTIEFAEVVAYKVGVKVKYGCDKGYTRKSGEMRYMQCRSNQDRLAQWTPAVCIVSPAQDLLLSEQPTPGEEEGSSHQDIPSTTAQPLMKDFCGVPKSPKHARIGLMTYRAGQEVKYQCMDGFQARAPISEISTCQHSNAWSRPNLRCTNDTMSGPPDVGDFADVIYPASGPPDVSGFADVIYPASAVFAIAMMATVVIL